MLYRHLIAGLFACLTFLGPGVRGAYAQTLTTTVRVERPDSVVRSRASLKGEVVAPAPVGTVLVVLDRDDDWVWVLLPPDVNGTRHPGYVRSSDLQAPEADPSGQPADKVEPKKKDSDESRRARQEQGEAARRAKQEQAEEARRLKQEKLQQVEESRRLKQTQAEETRRAKQQAEEDRRAKLQQVEEDRRLEKVKRDLEKAKQDFDKVAKPDAPEPPKEP